ncbi:RES family NAD+ phosphorylase [Chitinophaga sp. GCM10012297]|uniref:RES domain-containing protein n=1 Tax=Chitinophaga chungangae TaxID=2821488 RepID=A0ABS3YIT7_9BACT|nr:RES domain-containing protein [Chitinophaga chungangae]MBO9154590.1 hypothetical protein [Chitinophaga chungangae]
MKLYRLVKEDRCGNLGASGLADRWNFATDPCLHVKDHPAMCLVESDLVTGLFTVPDGYMIEELDVPDSIAYIGEERLPDGWDAFPFGFETREFGSALLQKAETLVLAFPSPEMAHQWNYLVNLRHHKVNEIKIIRHYPPNRRNQPLSKM